MSKTATNVLGKAQASGSLEVVRQGALIVGASLLVALCAQVAIPLPGTPVPLTLQNLAVLLVGLTLGSRRGFVALALYLVEGASGMPVFSPHSPGGILHLFGPTGGYLMAYPFVAGLAGLLFESARPTFMRAAMSGFLAEILLFASGIGWLAILNHSVKVAIFYGLYWFVFAEVIKIMFAAAIATRVNRARVKA